MQRFRAKLTYSNVISSVCLFLLLGGGTAFAASQLGKESVGTNQLKKGAVTPAKLSAAAKAGMQGPQGPQGQQGPRGATGARGATGLQGPKGDTGPTGQKGDKGDKGDPGEPGADANVLVYNLGEHEIATGTPLELTLNGSLDEWEEGAWQVQMTTPTTSYVVSEAGIDPASEYGAHLEEATPGTLKLVVDRFTGTTNEKFAIKITRSVGQLLVG